MQIHITGRSDRRGVELRLDGQPVAATEHPVLVEVFDGTAGGWQGRPAEFGYAEVCQDDGAVVGIARVEVEQARLEVTDTWCSADDGVRVERRVRCLTAEPGAAVRLVLDLDVVAQGFSPDSQVFAPPALYDLNDVDGDGVEDYLDTRELVFRDDRLLAPRRVELTESLEELTRLRLGALMPYYREDATTAGFVTNCHPQDGVQLGDVLQYGFTGQTVLNALHVLRHADEMADPEARAKGLRVVDSFVRRAERSPLGLVHTLYDFATQRDASWWSGLLLPLAYADEDSDIEELMGSVREHMAYAIDALSAAPDGTYLRCVAEEHQALLRAYRSELEAGVEHEDWLAVARSFGEFLLEAQESDGSWRRAYAFDGTPLIEPRAWFGRAELNQKSSTATAVPFLHELYRVTGEPRWRDAAVGAALFVAEHFVRRMKFNGGIHDSVYARAQLVDSESILFSLRACLAGAEMSDDADLRDAAVDAARILATWVYLWDVPLPPSSTMAGFGFRSTGWSACDTAGAGYIHPYELHAVPDLFEAAVLAADQHLAVVADLVLHGSNETVATEACDWGVARRGLQEEGLLVSWWLVDDPMFVDTGFGGRGKGEGNKTCLPWISAVGIDATDEVLRRHGTTELRAAWRRAVSPTAADAMVEA
jgi:hypothetical protein